MGIAFAIAVVASRTIGVGDTRAAMHVFALPERKPMALGLIAFLAVLVEGTVTDWSALYMSSEVEGAARPPSGSGYALIMIVGRLLGDTVVRAVGRTRIILYGAAVLFAGLGPATGPASKHSAVAGSALVGVGVANIVPAAFSASAAAASSPSLGIAMSAMAYAALLIGPPLLRRDRDGLELAPRVCDIACCDGGDRRVDRHAARRGRPALTGLAGLRGRTGQPTFS